MTRKKKIVIVTLVLGINALALVNWAVSMCTYQIKLGSFEDLEEFVDANGSRNPLWQGTHYQGDYKGRSYFWHAMMLGRSCEISVPADSWTYTPRFELTSHRKDWMEWYAVEGTGKGTKAEEKLDPASRR